MAVLKLKTRILPTFVVASILLFIFLLVVIYQEEHNHLKEEFKHSGEALHAVYASQLHANSQTMQAALGFLQQDTALRRAFVARDREQLQRLAAPVFQRLKRELNITHFYFIDPQRVCFLRVHQPQRSGDVIDRYTAREAERTGGLAYGVELGILGTFTLRVVMPWYHDGQLLGYLEMGEEVESLLKDVAAAFNVDLLFLIDKRYVERSSWEDGMHMLGRAADWDRFPDAVISFHTLKQLPKHLDLSEQSLPLPLIENDESHLWYESLSLRDVGMREVGRLLLVREVSLRASQLYEATQIIALVALVVGVFLFIFYYLVLDRAERKMALWEVRLRHEVLEREQLTETHIRDLEQAALYDSLTGLPNRRFMHDRIMQTIAETGPTDPFALVSLDLHRLREINDTLGHDIGDDLLQHIAIRIRRGLRTSDLLVRPGGGEFMMLLPGVNREVATSTAEHLHSLLSKPFDIQGLTLDVGSTFGIALYPDHGADASTLLRRVDVAMRYAKRSRENCAVYHTDQEPHSLPHLKLFGELRKSIQQGQLQLHYQPQLELASGKVARVEALARWYHPELGLVTPDEFVPLAEDTGLMRPLTNWVLNEALRQCSEWQEHDLYLQVGVNLSVQSLLDHALPEQIGELLERWQLDARYLSLEITESAFMHDPERALEVARRLHEMGLALSIDDFGTGYSSLAYLKRLPVRELKIDRGFVKEMLRDKSDAMIVTSTIDLAHDLGLLVVAEGVETLEVQQALAERGCDIVQGFYVSKPLLATELAQWLAHRPA